MIPPRMVLTAGAALLTLMLASCHSGGADRSPPPPDTRRPVLKSEEELAVARAERIATGEVVVTEAPRIEAQPRPASLPPRPEPIHARRNSIRSDILMVNESVLSVAEVLYPMREWIEQTRAAQTPQHFADQLQRRVRDHIRNEIGSLLVYEKAMSEFPEEKRDALDKAVEQEINKRVSREFGDSVARFQNHLTHYGLTMDQARAMVQRQMMISSYTHDLLTPQIRIRRDELLEYYRRNAGRYATEASRELLLIAAPFDKFLPAGVGWDLASKADQAQARLQAMRHIRRAYDALAKRDFQDVAREYSRGVHAADGGSWGQIGQPLRPPYDDVSRRIFELEEGQYTEPIETDAGWYIAQCGKVIPATQAAFADMQEQIRAELENERFTKLAGDYIYRLAERATISDLEGFINSAVERALIGWSDEAAPE
jgi:hypothetical protein